LDYYKRADRITRWRWILVAVAVLLAAGFAAASLLHHNQAALVSRGPVASAHAAWDNDCKACHTSFQPISSDALLGPALAAAHSSDQKCQTCHAGPPHTASDFQKEEDVPACAGCHREHRGRDADLNRVADADCTRCHANLPAHSKSQTAIAATVTGFDKEHHPEFKPQPQGTLKFNHKLHMTAGLESQFTLAKVARIDKAKAAWYANRQENNHDDAPVQLQCASCHRLDSADLPPGADGKPGGPLQQVLLPVRNAGNYMLPVSYNDACAACHPLDLERTNPKDPQSQVRVPHGMQPQELHDLLQGYYTAELLEGNSKLFERPAGGRPFPGKVSTEEATTARKDIANKVEAAEKLLYSKNTCYECHEGQEQPGRTAPKAIKATAMPAVWLVHATFDHVAHRAVDCKACHAAAYPDGEKAATAARGQEENGALLIPGLDNCVQCHAPRSRSGGVAQGGARTDCVECHRYHNGANPLQGIGATARAPQTPLDVRRFLGGGR
ncbi:MAG TPA: cytochrome c3 family protein, partial [Gemmataceae bacterium]|nr:cytochrome c3 family protein [Gemmataceae bacterium]